MLGPDGGRAERRASDSASSSTRHEDTVNRRSTRRSSAARKSSSPGDVVVCPGSYGTAVAITAALVRGIGQQLGRDSRARPPGQELDDLQPHGSQVGAQPHQHLAATPSPSRIRPSSMCSVPM